MNDNIELNQRLASLVAQCANADKDALAEIYHLTSAKLLAVQVRILGMNPTAERALHDTYSRVWLKAKDFNHESGNAMTWLTSIARNHALNLRRARNDGSGSDTPINETNEVSAEMADISFLENNPDAGSLHSALAQLDEPARVSIVTSYLDGLSENDLANVFNIPSDEVRSAVHAGLLAIRGGLHAPV